MVKRWEEGFFESGLKTLVCLTLHHEAWKGVTFIYFLSMLEE